MSKQWPAGIITPTPATPAGPYQNGAAPGVWTIGQAAFWVKQGLWPTAGNLAPYGYLAGGNSTATSFQTNIDYLTISTSGNATSFGNLSGGYAYALGCSSATRGVIAGGLISGGASVNTINYITLGTSGNSSSFGQMVSTVHPYQGASCASATRGIFAGGEQTAGDGLSSAIQYVTIATTGNSTAFGELREGLNPRNFAQFSGCSSPTRGVFGGGNISFNASGTTSVINYITIASTGNSSSFGVLAAATAGLTSFSNSTRGIFAGGSGSTTSISYVTIASTGNATAFGTLYATGSSGFYAQGLSSSTLGVFGLNAYDATAMQYLTIGTTGNSLLWGNLTQAKFGYAAMSTVHGGL